VKMLKQQCQIELVKYLKLYLILFMFQSYCFIYFVGRHRSVTVAYAQVVAGYQQHALVDDEGLNPRNKAANLFWWRAALWCAALCAQLPVCAQLSLGLPPHDGLFTLPHPHPPPPPSRSIKMTEWPGRTSSLQSIMLPARQRGTRIAFRLL
jgi:hypothetical protein